MGKFRLVKQTPFGPGKFSQEILVPQVGFERSVDHGTTKNTWCQSRDENPLATWICIVFFCV